MVKYGIEGMVLFSKGNRLSIGRPVSKILASQKCRHGRQVAHTKFCRLFQKGQAGAIAPARNQRKNLYLEATNLVDGDISL